MKLTVIGRDPQQADIVLSSNFVSSYHAELIQLDKGEMYLVDKSSNGTFINGQRLTPGKETPVRRGDNVMIADVALNWNQIEELRLPANVKSVLNIGSHFTCEIKIQGPNVSRFHASIRESKDGKWYICDYSKNGTRVNGQLLPKNQYVQLQKGDTIDCAGVTVNNPVKGGSKGFAIAGISAGAVLLCALLAFAVYKIFIIPEPEVKDYPQAVVFMACGYHFEVTAGSLPMDIVPDPSSKNIFGNYTSTLPSKFVIVKGEDGAYLSEYNGENSMPLSATGFFIGKEGHIVTNLHVAAPWLTDKLESNTASATMLEAAEDYYRTKLNALVEGVPEIIQYIAQVKVTGVLDYCYVIPNDYYFDGRNTIPCHVLATSTDKNVDLAIVKIRSKERPVGTSYIPLKKIYAEKPAVNVPVWTAGFPYGRGLQQVKDKQIQVITSNGIVSQTLDDNYFLHTARIAEGASGSPMFDNNGNLVGVVSAYRGVNGNNYYQSVYSSQLLKLMEKAGVKN